MNTARALLPAICAALFVSPAFAQPVADHLECFKVRDPQDAASYTADLQGLATEPGCSIKVPAKQVCIPTAKTITSDPPPGGGATGRPNPFLCYKVKCPVAALRDLELADQFGSRSVEPMKSKMLCAPAIDAAATTTTTSTTTTTAPPAAICPDGQTACGCVDTMNDAAHCGGCNQPCSFANGVGACDGGACFLASCTGNFRDCNGVASDGCEADILTDKDHCGSCATDCDDVCVGNVAATRCSSGQCAVETCEENRFNVDGICSNGCEGSCPIESCPANRYDIDGQCANGCECQGPAQSGGSFCGGSVNLATLNAGGVLTFTSKNAATTVQWVQVTFNNQAGASPNVSFSANPGAIYRMDVFSNCSTAVCFNAQSCSMAPGTYQIGIKSSATTCNNFTLNIRNTP